MSNPNLPLGIALVCGAAACAITCAVTDLGAGVGVSLGAVVAGASLIFQGQQQKPAEQREEKESKKESKKSKGKKPVKKQANTPSPRAPASPEPVEKKKSEKPKKDSAPKSPPQKSPAPKSPPQQTQQKAKSPQKPPPSVEPEQKEPTKTQLQKAKKKQKKEAEEKAKAEEKALEAKREQAQAKKAAKAAQKKKEKEIEPPQVEAQASDDEDVKEEEVLEDGWEKPKPRNTVRIRSPKDIKKAKDAAVARSKGPSSEEKVVVEVRVPKHKHGSIIGQKGAFLTLIQEKTGATVTMPKREGGGLGVVISGSAAQVKDAEQVVRDIANKGYSSLTHPGLESNELLLKDEKQIGRIAGKGGVYLKAIQEKSGASLQLPDRKSPQPSNKIIILGKPSEITNAKIALMDLMRQGYCDYTHPGWITEEFDFNSDYLGRLIGPGGSKISELSRDFDVKIDTPKQDDPNSTSKQDIIVIKGTQSNIDRAKEAIAELLSQTEVAEEIPAPDPNDPWQQDPVEPEW